MGDIFGSLQIVIKTMAHFSALASTEFFLLYGLQDDIEAIRNELQSMSVFLKNAEQRAEGDDAATEWVRQVRNMAYDIEDMMDRYYLLQNEAILGKAKKYLLLEKTRMALAIKSFRDRAINMARTRDSYKFTDSAVDQPVLTTTYFLSTSNDEAELVGAEIYKREIIKFLGLEKLNTTPPTIAPSMIAVVGMRGLGKTTVVSSVYNDAIVRSYFPVNAWISLTEPKEHVDILRSMLVQFSNTTTIEGHTLTELQFMDKKFIFRLLQKYLKDKRYMVVFDNAQEADIELGIYIKRLLPANNQGSKILMTTRYENVAFTWLDGSDNGMYKLKPLPFDKAWELFCKRAFHSSGGKCPSPLQDVSREIVQKCGGLPPAIVSIGRLLSSKANDMIEWKKVRHSLGFYLAENRHLSGVNKTLTQNYHDLPFYLKPCFLYFGMFPKDYPIERMRLLRLWIAEGFIRETTGNLTLEEVAQEYLSELINMSLIEAKLTDPTGKVRLVGVVSEFLHEMIYPKLDELSFCKVLSRNDSLGKESFRRFSIHKNYNSNSLEHLDSITKTKSNLRSLFLIDVEPKIMGKVFNKSFLKNVSLLKVLDLYNAPIDIIPKEIGKLLSLQYLSLRCTRVSVLPSSIGKLQNLLTLDLKQTFVVELPVEITHLHKLRHLLGYSYEHDFNYNAHSLKTNGVKIPGGALEHCLEMQKLAFFDLGVGHKTWVTELMNLTQLRKLGIIGLKEDEGKDLTSVIEELKYLQSLSVFSNHKSEAIDLKDVRFPPPMLQHLYMSGLLVSIPTWIYELQNIVKIRLRWSNLHVDPLEHLQLLPNLVELHLLEAFVGKHLRIESAGFQKLKILRLLGLNELKSVFISDGALPLLEEMSIAESPNLEVPHGIKYLSILKILNFYDMPRHFLRSLLPGEDCYPIVKHVPNVLYHNKHPMGYWQTYTI